MVTGMNEIVQGAVALRGLGARENQSVGSTAGETSIYAADV